MKSLELLLDLITSFTVKRLLAMLTVIVASLSVAWLVDLHFGYAQLYKSEKTVELLERLSSLDSKIGSDQKQIRVIHEGIVESLVELHGDSALFGSPLDQPLEFLPRPWIKAMVGALPFLLFSLISFIGVKSGKGAALIAFFALQFFTISAGIINYALPSSEINWVDYLLIPLAVFLIFLVIPVSIASMDVLKRVRENSVNLTIKNNLRRLSAAADQFFLEHGQSTALFDDLVGKDKYLAEVQPVDGEDYQSIEFIQGQPISVLRSNGVEVSDRA
jgi:hypothetical protein